MRTVHHLLGRDRTTSALLDTSKRLRFDVIPSLATGMRTVHHLLGRDRTTSALLDTSKRLRFDVIPSLATRHSTSLATRHSTSLATGMRTVNKHVGRLQSVSSPITTSRREKSYIGVHVINAICALSAGPSRTLVSLASTSPTEVTR